MKRLIIGVVVLGIPTLSAGISARATLVNWLDAICTKDWEKAHQYGVTLGPDGVTSYTILKENPDSSIGEFLIGKDWECQSLDSLRSWLTQAAAAMDTAENINIEVLEAIAHEAYEKQYRERYGDLPDSLLMVTRVDAGSSSERAGLKREDILLTFDGRPVYSKQVFYDVSNEAFHKRNNQTLFGELISSLKKDPHPGMAELVIIRARDTTSIWYPKEGDCIIPTAPLKATIESSTLGSVSTGGIISAAKEHAWKFYEKCRIFGAPMTLINRVYGYFGELKPAKPVAIAQSNPLGMMMTLYNGIDFILISQGHSDVAKVVSGRYIRPEDLECMGEGTLGIRNKTFDVGISGIFQTGPFEGLPWAWHYDIWVARCDRVVNGDTIPGKWLVIGGIEWEKWVR